MARKTLTDNMVAKLQPGPKRLTIADPLLRGHYLRVTPKGAKSYVAVARDPGGKQIWATIGSADVLSIGDARERARSAVRRIKDGLLPFEPPPPKPDSFKVVAENFLERHVRAKGLRTQAEIERVLGRDIYPAWKDREFASIRRADVARLLDTLQDASGPSSADHALTVVSSVMNWYASRSDDYVVPLARGMKRTDPKSRKRARILDDDELRTIWAVAEDNGTYGAILRLALLTAQRREKIVAMRWDDVRVDGTWNIPTAEREKGNGGVLALPDVATEIIRMQIRIGGNPLCVRRPRQGTLPGLLTCQIQIRRQGDGGSGR